MTMRSSRAHASYSRRAKSWKSQKRRTSATIRVNTIAALFAAD
jgi:hypothetical protein